MRKKKLVAVLLGLGCIAISACGKKETPKVVVESRHNKSDTEATSEYTKDNMNTSKNIKNIELSNNYKRSSYILDKLYESSHTNALFSPMSLNMALGMINNGAVDKSRELLNKYLDTDDYNSVAKSIMDKYYKYSDATNPNDIAYTVLLHLFLDYGVNEKTADHLSKYELSYMGIGKEGWKYSSDYSEFKEMLSKDEIASLYKKLDSIRNHLYSDIDKDTSQFNVANSVWISDTREIIQSFKDSVIKYYKANVESIDTSKPQLSADKINSWTADKTHDLIQNIINPNDINSSTSAILVNTIYFNSNWVEEWDTKEGTFKNEDGDTTKLEVISNKVTNYYETDDVTAFGMKYKNGFEFIGILPKSDSNSNMLDIDIEDILKNEKTSEYDEIYAEMPRIKFETDNKVIVNTLKEMGMGELFDDNAQFNKLVQKEKDEVTCISDIIQKCTIDLDEYGTEASAATAIECVTFSTSIDDSTPKIAEVILNRPFVFLLIEPETHQIAFMGKFVSVK